MAKHSPNNAIIGTKANITRVKLQPRMKAMMMPVMKVAALWMVLPTFSPIAFCTATCNRGRWCCQLATPELNPPAHMN